MQLTAYDYVRDRRTGGDSLARLAVLIARARTEAAESGALCLLLDNGDTLQGTPMGALLAREQVNAHPMVGAMNTLGYDAIGLGNHDFDHGIAYLARCISAFDAPVICSNLTSDRLAGLVPYQVLDRRVDLSSGADATLRIGVISALPEQTATWNRHHLDGSVQVTAPLTALARTVKTVRAEGADVVIALAHMGIAQFDEGDDAQNQIAEVAALPGVDTVIGGHTHLRFPGTDHRHLPGVDTEKGLIAGKPVVLPGSSGSDLGVIDLQLSRADENDAWQVLTSTSVLRQPDDDTAEEPSIVAQTNGAHVATRAYLARPVAQLAAPMHSYFALASPSPVPALMAAAKKQVIATAVAGTDLAQLPLLAAAATPATGGFEGPNNFISLPAGQLERRHLAGLIPYANQVWAVKANGARISGWLERSALLFNVLRADMPDQMLVDPSVPGFRYDTIYGLTYQIDLTSPSRFDAAGRPVDGAKGRVSDIRWQGQPVAPDQDFLVAVTDHRAGGGGTFRPFEDEDIVVRDNAPLDQALIDYLAAPDSAAVWSAAPWRFAPAPGISALLHTAPDALRCLSEIAHLRPEPCGMTADGFAGLRLHF